MGGGSRCDWTTSTIEVEEMRDGTRTGNWVRSGGAGGGNGDGRICISEIIVSVESSVFERKTFLFSSNYQMFHIEIYSNVTVHYPSPALYFCISYKARLVLLSSSFFANHKDNHFLLTKIYIIFLKVDLRSWSRDRFWLFSFVIILKLILFIVENDFRGLVWERKHKKKNS